MVFSKSSQPSKQTTSKLCHQVHMGVADTLISVSNDAVSD